jgi:hypothetical protein
MQAKKDSNNPFLPVKAVPKRGRPQGSKYDSAIQYAATKGACEIPVETTARVLYICVARRIRQLKKEGNLPVPVRACVRTGRVFLEKAA